MTDIALPAVPAGIIAIINFFAPYLVSLIVQENWSNKTKQLVAIATSVVLSVVVLVVAHLFFGLQLGADVPTMILLGVAVILAAYNIVHKELADALTSATSPVTGQIIDAGSTDDGTSSITSLPATDGTDDDVLPDGSPNAGDPVGDPGDVVPAAS